MKKHAEIVRPKFEVAFDALDALSPEIGTYQKPTGGYFISYDAKRPIAKRVIELCKEVGVLITPAGSTYPHFHDPLDSNIRLAPTFLGVEDLQDAMEVFVTAIMIAHQELRLVDSPSNGHKFSILKMREQVLYFRVSGQFF